MQAYVYKSFVVEHSTEKAENVFCVMHFLYFLLVCFSLNHSHVPFVQNLWEDGFTLLFLLSGT